MIFSNSEINKPEADKNKKTLRRGESSEVTIFIEKMSLLLTIYNFALTEIDKLRKIHPIGSNYVPGIGIYLPT